MAAQTARCGRYLTGCCANMEALPDPEIEWFNPSLVRKPTTLTDRMNQAMEMYPACKLLFVHRDAEAEPYAKREEEIHLAWNSAGFQSNSMVPVIPVRMTEAWLLFDKSSLRQAAGCPKGRTPIELPKAAAVERLADPKAFLHQRFEKRPGSRADA